MRRKTGIASLMAGPPEVKKRSSTMTSLITIMRMSALHLFLVGFCIFYIFFGAILFRYLEEDHEEFIRRRTERTCYKMVKQFVEKAEMLKETIQDEETLDSSLLALLDQHTQRLFELYENPIALNYFDSLVYRNNNYHNLWSMDQAVLLTATTMIPVGFGLTTPLTPYGRLFLIIYGMIGIPVTLVTMSDLGRFFCNAMFKLYQENMTALTITLLALLFSYPIFGGIWIHNVSKMTLSDSIYYCSITIFTIGFGDIEPPISIPALVLFIAVGVTLVTISVDIVAANAIHHVHYMGRQMEKAKEAAAKMIQKININKGLGIGMAQLGAFARMGMMIQVTPGNPRETTSTLLESPSQIGTAFEPKIDMDLIDRIGGGNAGNIPMDDFAWFD